MTSFVEKQFLEAGTCVTCSMVFAVPQDFDRMRRKDFKNFYCPAGHGQHYNPGHSDEDKLRREVEHEKRMREAADARAVKAEQHLAQVARAHHKMRQRVMNGVCPCCNRSFENLRDHMKTKHADFGGARTMLGLRQAFGMTQAAVATEAGVSTSYVSSYEREKPVPALARELLDAWVDTQSVARAA